MNRKFIVTEEALRDLGLLSFDSMSKRPLIGKGNHYHLLEDYVVPPSVDFNNIVHLLVNTISELNLVELCAQQKTFINGEPIYVINGVAHKITING